MNLDDTTRCPIALCCDICASGIDLDIVTFGSQLGVHCATICAACIEQAHALNLAPITIARRVGAHCEHLGIHLDQMADALFGTPESA